jgi:branched-chain amino acid transport system substrate-binding protein
MNKRISIILAVIAVIVVLGIFLRPGQKTVPIQARTLTIGAILPQTGSGAVFSDYIKKGLDLAATEIDKEGQTNVTIVYGDSKNDPKEGVSVFNQMVLTQKPPVVITALSSVTKAVAPLAKENNTVVIGTAVGLPNVTAPSDFVFRVYPEAIGLAGVIADYAASKFRTAAVVYINDDFGISGATVFEQIFQSKGGKVLIKEPYNIVEKDFRNQWEHIRREHPECVWVTGYGPAYSVIVRQMREVGVNSVLLADMTLGLPITLKNVGDEAEGVVYVDGIMDREFINRYRAAYGDQPTSYAGYAYDIIGMLNQVLLRGNTTPQAIRDGLAAIHNYQGAMGSISFLENRDAALKFNLMRIENGSPKQLTD